MNTTIYYILASTRNYRRFWGVINLNFSLNFNMLYSFRELDMMNLMTYDLHGPYESYTGNNAALHPGTTETGDLRYLNVVSFNNVSQKLSHLTQVLTISCIQLLLLTLNL